MQIESGAELLARLNSKASLRALEDTLFLEDPRNADVMEIGGEESTGKTLLLSQMLAKCILPDTYYRDGRIEGCNASAIFINTDHHFQTWKLIKLMSRMIDTASTVPTASRATELDVDKKIVIQNSLRNLQIIDCYNSEEFSLTLRTLDEIFLDNGKIALLAIDSVAAYYWEDSKDKISTMDTYVTKLLKLIKMHTTRFNVVTIYTRLYNCKKEKKDTNRFTNTLDYKVGLSRMNDSQSFLCTLERGEMRRKIPYSIVPNGIKWQIHGD